MTDQQTIDELQATIAKQKQLISDITAWHNIGCPHGLKIVELKAEVRCLKQQIGELINNPR